MWFKKTKPTLWQRLERALESEDMQAFVDLCANEAGAIVDAFPGWRKPPAQLSAGELQRYAHVLITVARVFDEVFDHPQLMDLLTGGADDPVRRWDDALRHASGSIAAGATEDAAALLETVRAEMEGFSGPVVDRMLGVLYGRLGECRTVAGDLTGALEYFDLALRHCREHGDMEGVLTYLGNRALLLHRAGRQPEASLTLAEVAETLSAVDTEALPENSASHAFLAAQLAVDLGEMDLALGLCGLGSDLAGRVPVDQADALSVAMNNTAEVLREAREFDHARVLLDAAIELRRRHIGADFVLARFLGNRGYLGIDTLEENRDRVEGVLLEALRIQEGTPDADLAVIAETLNNLGAFYQSYDDVERARYYYHRCVELKKTYLPPGEADFGATYANLARLELQQQSDTGAKPALEALREIKQKQATLDRGTRLEWANLCDIYLRMGNVADAEPLALALLEDGLRDESSFEYGAGLVKLADVRGAQQRTSEADRLYVQGIQILRSLPESESELSAALNNLGLLRTNAGQYDRALEPLRESLAIKEAILDPLHPDWASTANNLAIAESGRGEWGSARELLEKVLEVRRRAFPAGHRLIAQSLYNLGYCHLTRAEIDEGLSYVEAWMDAVVAVRVDVLAIASEAERLAYLREVRDELDVLTQVMFSQQRQHGRVTPVLFDAVLKMKGISLDALIAQNARLREHGGQEFERTVVQLREVRERIARIIREEAGSANPPPELREALAVRRRLETDLAASLPTQEFTETIRAANRHTVAAALPKDAALLEFFRFELSAAGIEQRQPGYLLFVLPGGEPDNVAMVVLGRAEAIDEAVHAIRNAIVGAEDADAARDERIRFGSVVTDHIFGHAAPQLTDKRRLVVAADGAFNRLPLELLAMSAGGVLGDRFDVSYLNTGRDLLAVPASVPARDPVVIGDPDFNLGAVGAVFMEDVPFERLADTAKESARIASLLGTEPWVGGEALESRVKAVHSPWILHIATHGFSASADTPGAERVMEAAARRRGTPSHALDLESLDNPLLASGLALAGANTWLAGGTPPPEAEDGLLLAEDVLSLDLRGTELVVLSACETGLGRYEPGEGIFGLRRAFLLAGARSLVVSLWSVPDEATQQLMIAFYEALLAGESRIGALRRAQQTVRAHHADPYYWGGFVLIGDAAPLRGVRRSSATRSA